MKYSLRFLPIKSYSKLSPNTSFKTVNHYTICRDRIPLSINYKNNVDQQKLNYLASFNILARNGKKYPNAVTSGLSRRRRLRALGKL